MSDKKIVNIALITKNSDIFFTDSRAEHANYAIKDLCCDKGWGAISTTIATQSVHVELVLPDDVSNGAALKEIKDAVSERLFAREPDIKEDKKGQLWSHNSVVIENTKGDSEPPEELPARIQQAIAFAYPGTHPSIKH